MTVSLRSAEGFAAGGVEILDRLGVEGISFGAETADPGDPFGDGPAAPLSPVWGGSAAPSG